ncbi:hypothetical protein JAB9_10250 [Janthinobacterium sp. HH107]|uniref:hypothetical protein n=1 Tax=unclassified Janthinobacterium TaxID=2610881 RepID=UPI000875430E|nr:MULTISPECIES: hypothetical protein [unclassified Janthinobacterium]OEZ93354.1 hypothetical protein JAB8_04700 [Janthinobacterium sp. HH106]OFA05349.1 hypothetical protein JAB9_10250 [Janthinobacterium sp. HH107]
MRQLAFSRIAVLMGTCLTGLAIAAPTVHLSASPDVVAKGTSTSIAWDALGAESCAASWSPSLPLTGSYTPPALQGATSYTVTCQGGGASVSQQVMVQLAPACVTNCFTKRWIYFYGGIAWGKKTANADFNKLSALIVNAAALGYNGIVVNIGGEDSYISDSRDSPDFAGNLAAIKQLALEQQIELIPMGGHPHIPAQLQPELSEALAVEKTPFVVTQGRAVPAVRWLANDNFSNGNGPWDLMDPGTVSFDGGTDHLKTGNVPGKGAIRLSQPNVLLPDGSVKTQTRLHRRFVNLKAHTAYRVSFWLRTANYKAPLKVQIYDDAVKVPLYLNLYPMGRGTTNGAWNALPNTVLPDQDWTNYNFDFNTGANTSIRFYLGAWSNAKNNEAGQAWIDDMQIREIGLAHTITRAGLPIVVTSADGTVQYSSVNGKDYVAGIESLAIPATSAIPDGSNLLVSWYQEAKNMMPVWTSPASACPPQFMALQRQGYEKIKALYPTSQKFFINYDEWRIMNWDPTCQYASAGAYLAGTMTAMQAMVKQVNPGVELYVWNDMFDPNMNAIDKYFMVNGSLLGAADGIDPNTVIVNWTQRNVYVDPPAIPLQQSSLKFFHDRNLKQVIALYYDDLPLTDEWLDNLDAAEADGVTGVDGFMYTTWVDNGKYDDLAAVASKIKARAKARWPQ